jgi:hypothetical protein
LIDGWSWWTGHLIVLNKLLKRLPVDANVFYNWQEQFEKDPDSGLFLLDLWPMYAPQLFIWDSEAAAQVSTKLNLPKPADSHKQFGPVVGGVSMISMSDKDWKPLRALFNPGFSGTHMSELVPAVVDSVEVFCELLREHVDKGNFSLDELATRLTMDVITKVTLATDLDNQRREHYFSFTRFVRLCSGTRAGSWTASCVLNCSSGTWNCVKQILRPRDRDRSESSPLLRLRSRTTASSSVEMITTRHCPRSLRKVSCVWQLHRYACSFLPAMTRHRAALSMPSTCFTNIQQCSWTYDKNTMMCLEAETLRRKSGITRRCSIAVPTL